MIPQEVKDFYKITHQRNQILKSSIAEINTKAITQNATVIIGMIDLIAYVLIKPRFEMGEKIRLDDKSLLGLDNGEKSLRSRGYKCHRFHDVSMIKEGWGNNINKYTLNDSLSPLFEDGFIKLCQDIVTILNSCNVGLCSLDVSIKITHTLNKDIEHKTYHNDFGTTHIDSISLVTFENDYYGKSKFKDDLSGFYDDDYLHDDDYFNACLEVIKKAKHTLKEQCGHIFNNQQAMNNLIKNSKYGVIVISEKV